MGLRNDQLTNDLFQPALLPVTLQCPGGLEGFRRIARELLARQIPPERVNWHSSGTPAQDLFAGSDHAGEAPAINVPSGFLALCQDAILHSDPGRFSLLYRILWRLVHEPGLRHDPLDADMVQARQMAQVVRQDIQNMKALVRFRSVQDETFQARPESGPLHLAWFEPGHHIVEAVAPFFARRFSQMRWAILTPGRSVESDYLRPHARHPAPSPPGNGPGALRFGPGANRRDAPAPDAGEQIWLAYYQHIFHPARLQRQMMHNKIPRRYRTNRPGTNATGAQKPVRPRAPA